jgi:hypothetical protein
VTLLDLQSAIDDSLAHASPFTAKVFGAHPWDAGTVERFVNRVGSATVATVAPCGRPHAALVVAGCLDGVLYFTATPGSALLRHLAEDPRVAVTVTDQVSGVMADGTARLAAAADELGPLVERLSDLVPRDRFVPDGWDGCLYAVDLDHIFAA